MALRNQPYLPLYVQDFLTDEKLRECSAQTVGVYIMIMCLMHKSQEYGKISLSKFDKRTDNITNDFATKLMKHLPFPFHTVTCSLEELLDRDVLTMENEAIIQKRMVKDNVISEKRAASGKKGGITTQSKDFAKANALAKVEANTENENENEGLDVLLLDTKEPIEGTNKIHFYIAKSFHNLFIEIHGKNKTLAGSNYHEWLDIVRKIIDLDKVTAEQFVAIKLYFEAAHKKEKGTSSFWPENIYSLNALRKKDKDGTYRIDRIVKEVKKWLELSNNDARVRQAHQRLEKLCNGN